MCDSAACCPLALDVPLPFTRRNFLLFAQHWPQDPTGGQYTIDVFSFSLPHSDCVKPTIEDNRQRLSYCECFRCFKMFHPTKNITASCVAPACLRATEIQHVFSCRFKNRQALVTLYLNRLLESFCCFDHIFSTASL